MSIVNIVKNRHNVIVDRFGGFVMKVLIVEDDKSIANLVKINLVSEGMNASVHLMEKRGQIILKRNVLT